MKCEIECHSERLEWLSPMLRRWAYFIDDYCAIHKDDIPYYYNERCGVGMLAAAAWGPGSGSLEEYTCERASDELSAKKTWGRADLYVYTKGKSATIEAKQVWWNYEGKWSEEKLKKEISVSFSKASSQAKTNRDVDLKIAAVFATLILPKDTDAMSQVESARQAMLGSGAGLIAWVLPDGSARESYENYQNEKRLWPGVVLGLKVVTD